MRKQTNGLAIIAAEQMEQDPLSGALFLFCNRYRRIMKALYWDRNGFCLWLVGACGTCTPMHPGQKKLEKDRYPWPDTEEAARKITAGELRMLLDGIDFWQAHQELSYRSVS